MLDIRRSAGHEMIVICIASFLVVVPVHSGAAHEKEAKDQTFSSWKFAGGADFIQVPVNVAGDERTFLLSTSSPLSVFDTSLRDGLTPIDDGARKVTRFVPPVTSIGGESLSLQGGVNCRDLSGLRSANWCRADGLLGVDYLRRHIVEINFDKGQVVVLENVPDDPGWPLSVTWSGQGGPLITGFVGQDQQEQFAIVTANVQEIILRSPLYDELKMGGRIKETSSSLVAVQKGPVDMECGRLDALQIGGKLYRDLVVFKGPMSLIGNGFLSRHRVVLDLNRDRIYFRKGERFSHRESTAQVGMALARKDGLVMIRTVEPGSLADKAGCQVGDSIVKIDDMVVDLRKHTRLRIQSKILGHDNNVTLLLRRDGEELTVMLRRQPNGPE